MKSAQYISWLLAVLLLYAGLVKLIDVDLFRLQMSKSPLLPSSVIPLLSYAVPLVEILLAFCLLLGYAPSTALLTAFGLMALFTVYLAALYFFYRGMELPCSCGGILGKMGYPVHIAFNLFFTLVAGAGYVQAERSKAAPNSLV